MGSNNPPNTNNMQKEHENRNTALALASPGGAQSSENGRRITFSETNLEQNSQHDNLSLRSVTSMQTLQSSTGSQISLNPRAPKNLQSLLNFALQATQAEDAPQNSDLTPQNANSGPLDEERRRFLEEALRSLTVNVSEVLDNAIKVLTDRELLETIHEDDELPDEVKNASTALLDYVDDMDVANDFCKMGGFAIFPICYSNVNADLRARVSSILGTLCQNNPYCQEKAMSSGLLPVLLSLLQMEQGNALAKCLYALSCLSRGYEAACLELIKEGICPVLIQLLNELQPPVKTKAAFLIGHFCQNFATARKQFIRLNIIRLLAEHIQAERNESTEHLLSILQILVSTGDPVIIRLCKDNRYHLKKTLEEHLKRPELADERFLEEKQYCRNLLAAIFGGGFMSLVEQADR